MASRLNRTLTDHDEIRRWAEDRGAKPACVLGTGSDREPGMLRLDFPGFTGEKKLREITWDEWFRSFDKSGLALIVQDKTAGGKKSNFNKLISRGSAERRERAASDSHRKEGDRGTKAGVNRPSRGGGSKVSMGASGKKGSTKAGSQPKEGAGARRTTKPK